MRKIAFLRSLWARADIDVTAPKFQRIAKRLHCRLTGRWLADGTPEIVVTH